VCIVVLFFQVHPQIPLIVAANRDEYYARRSTGPEILFESPRVVGGRDLERGGTWMGVAEGGLLVGLTNQRTLGPPEPARRSRGEIVLAALHTGSVAGIERSLASIDARGYNPFNLVFGDARALRVAMAREEDAGVRVHTLGPGLHVIGNDTPGAPSWKVRRAEELARPLAQLPWFELAPALHRLLADHTLPAPEELPVPPPWMDRDLARHLQSICVHTPIYGTRSSTLAAIGSDGVMHYAFAAGPPCMTPLFDVTHLLAAT
jgi:uncharacterized protein with NRDE domain